MGLKDTGCLPFTRRYSLKSLAEVVNICVCHLFWTYALSQGLNITSTSGVGKWNCWWQILSSISNAKSLTIDDVVSFLFFYTSKRYKILILSQSFRINTNKGLHWHFLMKIVCLLSLCIFSMQEYKIPAKLEPSLLLLLCNHQKCLNRFFLSNAGFVCLYNKLKYTYQLEKYLLGK